MAGLTQEAALTEFAVQEESSEITAYVLFFPTVLHELDSRCEYLCWVSDSSSTSEVILVYNGSWIS